MAKIKESMNLKTDQQIGVGLKKRKMYRASDSSIKHMCNGNLRRREKGAENSILGNFPNLMKRFTHPGAQ